MDQCELTFLGGVDWAHSGHYAVLVDRAGSIVLEELVEHCADELESFCERLRSFAPPESIGIAIERPDGIVVETLMDRGFQVFSINPKQLDRFRDRFTMSGAKDDRRDAHVLADSLRTDARAFRRLVPTDPNVIELREWSRIHSELGPELRRLTSQWREQLRRYYPQFVELDSGLDALWLLDLWEKCPTPAKAQKTRRASVHAILKRHRIRRFDASAVQRILRKTPMTCAPGVESAATAHIRQLVSRIRLVLEQLKEAKAQIQSRLSSNATDTDEVNKCEQHDVTIALSVPGMGPIVLATLLAEASRAFAERDYTALRALSGVAPVTKRSGRMLRVERRLGRNPRLANALHHWAAIAAQRDDYFKKGYQELRGRGQRRGRALRTIGDRLLRMLCAMLRDGSFYQPRQAKTAA